MSSSAVIILAIVLVVVFGGLFVFTTAARRDREAAVAATEADEEREEAAPAGPKGREVELAAQRERKGGREVVVAAEAPPVIRAPMDPETLDVTRRQFLNRGIVTFFGFGLAGFGTAALGFLWPSLSGGFGSKITVGQADELTEEINSSRKPKYVAEARSWIALYPKDALGNAKKVYKGGVLEGMEAGFVALYQKCVHLGCRVPFCDASQWFECPCHGSRYNRVGEKTGGPAPRGLDRFGIQVSGGTVVVDTSEVVDGPPIGTDTTGQGAEGPHCA